MKRNAALLSVHTGKLDCSSSAYRLKKTFNQNRFKKVLPSIDFSGTCIEEEAAGNLLSECKYSEDWGDETVLSETRPYLVVFHQGCPRTPRDMHKEKLVFFQPGHDDICDECVEILQMKRLL